MVIKYIGYLSKVPACLVPTVLSNRLISQREFSLLFLSLKKKNSNAHKLLSVSMSFRQWRWGSIPLEWTAKEKRSKRLLQHRVCNTACTGTWNILTCLLLPCPVPVPGPLALPGDKPQRYLVKNPNTRVLLRCAQSCTAFQGKKIQWLTEQMEQEALLQTEIQLLWVGEATGNIDMNMSLWNKNCHIWEVHKNVTMFSPNQVS